MSTFSELALSAINKSGLSPKREEAKTFSSYSEAIASDSTIDNVLLRNGFTRVSNYVISKGGERKIAFIKAYTVAGDVCIIDVSESKDPGIQIGAQIEIKPLAESKINSELVYNAMSCLSPSACGVVLDCHDEVCFARRDEKNDVISASYSVEQVSDEGEAIGSFDAMAHPIVSLQAIIDNKEEAIVQIRAATKLLRSRAFNESLQILNSIAGNAASLMSQINSLKTALIKTFNMCNEETQSELKELDDIRGSIAKGQKISLDYHNQLKNVVDRLYKFSLSFNDIVGLVSILPSTKKKLFNIETDIIDSRMGAYIKMRQAFEPNFKISGLNPQIWGLPPEFSNVSLERLLNGDFPDFNGNESVASIKRIVSAYRG